MKKIFSVALVVLMFIFGGAAQAMRAETIDTVKFHLDKTEGFDAAIRGGNVKWSTTFLNDCTNSYNALYSFLKTYQPQKDAKGRVVNFLDKADRECIYCAANVLILRINTLKTYILAMEAYENKQYEHHKKMMDICSQDWQSAIDLRQSFRYTYGF